MKKLLTILTVVAMVAVALVGCGGGNDNPDNALVIGGIGPLTGDYANYGTSVRNGAQIAIDEIKEAGVNGYEFVLQFEDSQGDPEKAVVAYGKLMDDGMKVSLGGVLSGETTSVAGEAVADDILVLTPSGSALDAIKASENAFRVCFNDPQQGVLSAQYIAENAITDKVAVFYASDVDYSVGLYESFKAECANQGISIVETVSFTSTTNTDFSTQISKIKESGVDLIFMPIYAQEAAAFLSQAHKANAFDEDTLYFGCDGLDGILQKIDKAENAENVVMLTPFSADAEDEKTKSFVEKYKAKYNAVPDQFAADGYDAIYAIKAAVEKAGLKFGEDEEDFNNRIVAAMTEIKFDGLTGKDMSWTADGETVKAPLVMVIKDGKAVPFTK